MTSIRVLPDDLVNQIAAGEVVERPSSVVKELVENALDAGATRVDVAITEGGARWIQVVDDGSGLARADAELAFSRHATSKIASAQDLGKVATLGFRGEALASIASVSDVRMRTCARGEVLGTEVRGRGGGPLRVRDLACPVGTRIEVAELFGRVPARRKFLKTATTESTHVVRWLERVALARPDVRFSLERDGRSALLLLPTEDLRERLVAVLPPGIGERMVEVNAELDGARLRGFASPTDVQRGGTQDLHLFVNSRPVRDRLLLFAVRDVYRDALPPGRHPVVVLDLEVAPDQIDVNVHPAKWEVRFHRPDTVRRLFRHALGTALGLGARTYPLAAQGRAWGVADAASGLPRPPAGRGAEPEVWGQGSFGAADPLPPPPAVAGAGGPGPGFRFSSLGYVGQALGTFLVFEASAGLVLLDQHAAHERVLFERMRRALLDGKLERQALLVPLWFEIPTSAADALMQAATALEEGGFELEFGEPGARGGARIGVRAVPALLAARRDVDWVCLLEQSAAALRDPAASQTRDGLEGALHGVLASAACHAATRKGDRLLPREVRALLEALDETIWFPNCPHGRPILSILPESEIERRFLRR